jgi:hypothetical protein
MADRDAERNAHQVASVAEGHVQPDGAEEVEGHVGLRLGQQPGELPTEKELAVALTIGVREAHIER